MVVKKPFRVSPYVVGKVKLCPYTQFLLRASHDPSDFANQGVYVLELEENQIYVGKSNHIAARIDQHRTTKSIIRRLMPYTPYCHDFESWERNETLHWMAVKGIPHVRGWMFTTKELKKGDVKQAFRQICEKYDLCRKCGQKGHFIEQCPNPAILYPAMRRPIPTGSQEIS